MNDCREGEINTAPKEADLNQEVFDFTSSPFSIKEAWILTQEDSSLRCWSVIFVVCWFSEGSHYALPQGHVASSMSLDLVTNFGEAS